MGSSPGSWQASDRSRHLRLSLGARKKEGQGARGEFEDTEVAMRESNTRESKISSVIHVGTGARDSKDKKTMTTTRRTQRTQRKKGPLSPETIMVAKTECREGGPKTASSSTTGR